MNQTQNVLQLKKVGRQYGEDVTLQALIDVDLKLQRGEWLAITFLTA